jgi:RHS repeat-associated protein
VRGEWRHGKLVRAVRHNYFDGVRDFLVEERYWYGGLGGRISKRRTQVGVVGEDRETPFEQEFTWNELGAPATQSYPQLLFNGPGRTVRYEYTNGYLTAIPGYVQQVTYHPNGMVRRTVHANGVVDEQELDASGMARPGRIRSLYAIKDWTTGTFRYDGAGHIVGIGSDWYRYDGLGRVKEGTAWRSDGTQGRQTYQYDGFGNLTRIWTAGAGARTLDVSPATNRLSGASYDGAGNQTSWGSGALEYQYTYSPFNQVRMTTGGAPPVTRFHAYTAAGERIASYAGDTDVITHTFRDLEGRVVREYGQVSLDGSWSWMGDYVWGNRGLVATMDETDYRLHHHVDHLGSPRHVTHPNGFEEARHRYYAFGEESTDPDADPTRIKFTGHERDLNLSGQTTDDLDYMHARHYNPNLGRFLSVDPVDGEVGRSQSWNRYTYAWNNPVQLIDPDGRLPTAAEIADDLDEKISATKEAGMRWASDGSLGGVALAATIGTAADAVKVLLVDKLRLGDGVGTAISDSTLSLAERGMKVVEDLGRLPTPGKIPGDETSRLLRIMDTKIGGGKLLEVSKVTRTNNGRMIVVGTTTDGKVVSGFVSEREAWSVVYGQLVDGSVDEFGNLNQRVNATAWGSTFFLEVRCAFLGDCSRKGAPDPR